MVNSGFTDTLCMNMSAAEVQKYLHVYPDCPVLHRASANRIQEMDLDESAGLFDDLDDEEF